MKKIILVALVTLTVVAAGGFALNQGKDLAAGNIISFGIKPGG